MVVFPDSPPGDYWVIGTDYNSYASVYSCKEFGSITFEFAWVLLRDVNSVNSTAVDEALDAFESNGIQTDNFEVIDHTDCDYEAETACGPPPLS